MEKEPQRIQVRQYHRLCCGDSTIVGRGDDLGDRGEKSSEWDRGRRKKSMERDMNSVRANKVNRRGKFQQSK